MRWTDLLVWVLFLSLLGACSGDEKIVYVYLDSTAPDGGLLTVDGATDTAGADADSVRVADWLADALANLGSEWGDGAVGADDGSGDDLAAEQGSLVEGEVVGDALIVEPAALEGLFVFGLGIEPQSALGSVGTTAAGSIALPAVVELGEDVVVIRVFSLEDQEPVAGEEGIIESYAATTLEDGRVKIDFGEPLVSLEVQLWGGCTYGLVDTIPIEDPLFADGLLTWTAVEQYTSSGCGNQGLPSSMGINVHYLRRFDANPTYIPRAVDPELPFGFFQLESATSANHWLTRLPYVGANHADGQVVYYLDLDFPEELRPLAHEAIEHWNDVLDFTAGNRPLVLVEGSPALVAWDPRYHVIAWDDSKSSGAIAPFTEHPATGEMIDTDVVVWLANFDELVASYTALLNDNPDLSFEFGVGDETQMALPDFGDSSALSPRVLRRRAYSQRPLDLRQVAQLLGSLEVQLSEDQVKELIILDFLIHELGHNLGLRHNFLASADWVHKSPVITSTSSMDYVIGMTHPGAYDADAMRYAYGEGPQATDFLYCTDEDLMWDPGCEVWDLGHPVEFVFAQLDALIEAYPPGTPESDLEWKAEEQEWSLLFRKLRQFFGSSYETYDPEVEISTFMGVLERVLCHPYVASEPEPSEEPVEDPQPPAEDAQSAGGDAGAAADGVSGGPEPPPEDAGPNPEGDASLGGGPPELCSHHDWLRSQWALYLLYTKFSVDGQWHSWPALTDAERTILYDAFFQLILHPGQSPALKQTIVNKLPTSAVPGASDLLDALEQHFEGLTAPEAWEQEVLDWIVAAQG